MAEFDRNGWKLFYEDSGGDGPPVLLIHGLLMDHTMFANQVTALKDRYRLVTPDLRAHGASEHRAEEYTQWDLMEDNLALLDSLGIERAMWGGVSQGGFQSLRAALGHRGHRALPAEGVPGIAQLSPRTRHARRLFAGVSPQYDAVSAVWGFGQDARWRRFLVSRIPPGSKVLDVATGTGMVATELAKRGCTVIGLDQSEEMMRRSKHPETARFVAGQAERLPFPGESFDAVTF